MTLCQKPRAGTPECNRAITSRDVLRGNVGISLINTLVGNEKKIALQTTKRNVVSTGEADIKHKQREGTVTSFSVYYQ